MTKKASARAEVHVSEPGKTIYFQLQAWATKSDSGTTIIKLTGPEGFITTVHDDPASKRYHPHLFERLRKLLRAHNAWPYG